MFRFADSNGVTSRALRAEVERTAPAGLCDALLGCCVSCAVGPGPPAAAPLVPVPAVYEQFRRRRRQLAPFTLSLTVSGARAPTPRRVHRAPQNAREV